MTILIVFHTSSAYLAEMKRTWYHWLSFGLLFVMGSSGLYGGLLLIADPSGDTLQMPASFLDPTPFPNYLLPGLLLLLVVGVLEWVTAVFTLLRQRQYAFWIILSGGALAIWITVQVIMIGYLHWMQPLCFGWGIALLLLGAYAARQERLRTE